MQGALRVNSWSPMQDGSEEIFSCVNSGEILVDHRILATCCVSDGLTETAAGVS